MRVAPFTPLRAADLIDLPKERQWVDQLIERLNESLSLHSEALNQLSFRDNFRGQEVSLSLESNALQDVTVRGAVAGVMVLQSDIPIAGIVWSQVDERTIRIAVEHTRVASANVRIAVLGR